MASFPALTLPRRILRSDFLPEWVGAAVVGLIATLWAAAIGFHLVIVPRDFLVLGIALAITAAIRAFAAERFALVAEYFALTLLATTMFGVLSYLSMTTGMPLVDRELLAGDRTLGFDWLGLYRWLEQHRRVARPLEFAYDSLVYQGLYFGVLFGLMKNRAALREMFWLVFAAGLLTSLGAALWPAYGPFRLFHLEQHGPFLPDMVHLHSGRNLSFALANMTGVVSFPSFHTTMALVYFYGFWRAPRPVAIAAAVLNLAMLAAIPFCGGHYLMDMFAGAAVFALSLAAVRLWPRLQLSLPLLRSESAMGRSM